MILEELQEKYLQSRAEKDFNILFHAVYKLAENKVINKLKKCKQCNEQKIKQYATEATENFMMMYIKNKAWKCEYFKTRLAHDVTYVMYNKKKSSDRYYYEHTVDGMNNDIQVQTKQEKKNIMDLVEHDKDKGKILILAYKAGTHRDFISRLKDVKTKFWIYDNAEALHDLFRYTRHG